jgi:hypothetical protein
MCCLQSLNICILNYRQYWNFPITSQETPNIVGKKNPMSLKFYKKTGNWFGVLVPLWRVRNRTSVAHWEQVMWDPPSCQCSRSWCFQLCGSRLSRTGRADSPPDENWLGQWEELEWGRKTDGQETAAGTPPCHCCSPEVMTVLMHEPRQGTCQIKIWEQAEW